jgi:hypothetical protein
MIWLFHNKEKQFCDKATLVFDDDTSTAAKSAIAWLSGSTIKGSRLGASRSI